ncbi:beta-1,3-galactosyltransferase-like protein [Selaginella moellendorffii]|uniref:Beta-1,3-galactosyltransferase-like protein n=1 Tax=Selaginella moellendorffii TaxID=88036 RepID=D8SQM6_SELML|nr:hydroxyproline O-galactosyltransferase GALT6 [Selaginella moellendorffii]EFJ13191.1 beta-1,3-galactosyltransferase-like protein [Selaginella moellendorffii]|eukprot:XP_002985613.1 hydroxyproline O-galactosyltransferase GALT6 [Selaginella moellendorffii]
MRLVASELARRVAGDLRQGISMSAVTSKRKVHWRWKLLAYAFFLAMASCLIYMTILVPQFLKPSLLIFDGFSSIDESYKNAHEQYEVSRHHHEGPGQIRVSKPERQASKEMSLVQDDVYKWYSGLNPLLRKTNKGTSFIIKQPRQALKQWMGDVSELQRAANEALAAGSESWKNVVAMSKNGSRKVAERPRGKQECPLERTMTRQELENAGMAMVLPCGLEMGSSVTVVGKPHGGRMEYVKGRVEKSVMVRQFVVELQALKPGRTEEPPRVLHLNPRLSGDWSDKPVIEINSCFHGKWGVSQRCHGLQSQEDETVDGLYQCEEWLQEGTEIKKSSGSLSWWKSLFQNAEKSDDLLWHFPFAEDRFFVLTIRAGFEGYHLIVDGRHIASFPYREDFSLEDATGVFVGGHLDVHLVMATSLRLSNSSIPLTETLELIPKWKAPVPANPSPELFIGISSTSSHFGERMAARKTWMRSPSILSGRVVARFFVALCADNYMNLQVKQEADFYGDMIIIPFMDRYELVVLKTIAICEFGVRNFSAKYTMKCDDDTFSHVESILHELEMTPYKTGLYMGNINRYHRPQRMGKWAVTYKEWPEDEYPLYADGPGYVVSADIANFIVEHHEKRTLRIFKMEDVSMGLWVSQFALSNPVYYIHHSKFCQWGCVEDYYTAHYMSPRQMVCMWQKLSRGKAQCCNM